ncbi:peptidase S49 [Parabacteroides sp. AM08-6]|uniref:peptidase S49 n=1 Tax=Parabacteroides sp. AM08-6 TaxID=2292053 RepID=UPI000EFDEC4A|nr:peptidase S49 [Parabacteroides sp. AM08-6]RHJ83530.1 peptidase S49 [Parabacteroides sp. AM08-6]
MKWLKDESYNAMKQAADNWNKLLNQVLGDNPDMKAEDVTVESLLEAIEEGSGDAGLQEKLTAAQGELKQKDQQIEKLQSDVAELKGTPVEKQQEAKVDNEPGAGEEDIKDFAAKNSDDTLAIMAKARETGFFDNK